MTIKDRLDQLVLKLNIKASPFEKSVGLSNGYLRNVKNVSADTCVKIVKVYSNVSLNWLLFGDGEMFLNNPTENAPKVEQNIDKADQAIGNVEGNVEYNPCPDDAQHIKDLEKDVENLKGMLVHKEDIIAQMNINIDQYKKNEQNYENRIAELKDHIAELRERITELKSK